MVVDKEYRGHARLHVSEKSNLYARFAPFWGDIFIFLPGDRGGKPPLDPPVRKKAI